MTKLWQSEDMTCGNKNQPFVETETDSSRIEPAREHEFDPLSWTESGSRAICPTDIITPSKKASGG